MPERFMGDEAPKVYRNLHAFGRGPRSCLGVNLAYAEMYLTLAALLTSMKLELYETTIEDFTIEDFTIVKEYFVGVLPAESKGVRASFKPL